MIVVVAMCGPPGVGKSTLVRRWAADHAEATDSTIIELDDIYHHATEGGETMGSRGCGTTDPAAPDASQFRPDAWKASWDAFLTAIEGAVRAATTTAAATPDRTHVVLAVDVMHLKSFRRDILGHLRRVVASSVGEAPRVAFGSIMVRPAHVATCLQRNAQRTQHRIPDTVVQHLVEGLECGPCRGQAEAMHADVITEDEPLDATAAAFNEAMTTLVHHAPEHTLHLHVPAPPAGAPDEDATSSAGQQTHRLDLLLRTVVARMIATILQSQAPGSQAAVAALGKHASKVKQQVLKAAKHHPTEQTDAAENAVQALEGALLRWAAQR